LLCLRAGGASEPVGGEASAGDQRVQRGRAGEVLHRSGQSDRRRVHLADDGAAAEESVGVPEEFGGRQQPNLGSHRIQQPPLKQIDNL